MTIFVCSAADQRSLSSNRAEHTNYYCGDNRHPLNCAHNDSSARTASLHLIRVVCITVRAKRAGFGNIASALKTTPVTTRKVDNFHISTAVNVSEWSSVLVVCALLLIRCPSLPSLLSSGNFLSLLPPLVQFESTSRKNLLSSFDSSHDRRQIAEQTSPARSNFISCDSEARSSVLKGPLSSRSHLKVVRVPRKANLLLFSS